MEKMQPLSKTEERCLKTQKISPTKPGTILRDFNAFVKYLGKNPLPATSKTGLFQLEALPMLNELLSRPIGIRLRRPIQKSYPHVNGLYLLLRATSLLRLRRERRKCFFTANRQVWDIWEKLNAVEQYFTLLEAWMLEADVSLIEGGGSRTVSPDISMFWDCFDKDELTIDSQEKFESLRYLPRLFNLALMDLFGLVEVEDKPAKQGFGWTPVKIRKTEFGTSLMKLLKLSLLSYFQGLSTSSEGFPASNFGIFQRAFKNYFPDWRTTLVVPKEKFRDGLYVFKVSLGRIWRRIAISAGCTMEDLSDVILDGVGFDCDHLYAFMLRNHSGCEISIDSPNASPGGRMTESADSVKVGSLPIQKGSTFTYIFDFGDNWQFRVELESTDKDKGKDHVAKVIESKGKAPEQYPDW